MILICIPGVNKESTRLLDLSVYTYLPDIQPLYIRQQLSYPLCRLHRPNYSAGSQTFLTPICNRLSIKVQPPHYKP